MTQRQIANRLRVSVMTVSRALRGEKGISDKTRQRVLTAARKAGMALPPVQRLARHDSLRQVLCTIGIGEAPADLAARGEGRFHQRLREGLWRGARECGSEMVYCREGVTAAEWPTVVARCQVDGAVLICGNEHELIAKVPCPVPLVYIFNGPPPADVVAVSDFRGGRQLGQHLAALGHRRVAFIGPETRMARERLAGLRTGLEPAGGACPPDQVQLKLCTGGQEPGFINDLLAGETRPAVLRERFTAIACYNDWFAANTLQRLRELGLRVPEELSVTGFDNVIPFGYDGPKLTTCAVPVEELGAEAARLLYWRLDHPKAIRRTLTLETELVPGESAGRV